MNARSALRVAALVPAACLLSSASARAADPIPPGAIVPSAIQAWATRWQDYLPGPNVEPQFRTPDLALGPADPSRIVSLGDRGRITLTFAGRITNGPGADFAVFENGFDDNFLELAWVDVSSDGRNFFRFPGFVDTPNPIGSFGTLDPNRINGVAGKYRGGLGTPFDLDLLKAVPGLDVNAVRYVRIVDIVGDGSEVDSLPAAFGGPRPIHDPFPTVISGGFDLDAVGALHFVADPAPVPEPGTWPLLVAGGGLAVWRIRRARLGRSRRD